MSSQDPPTCPRALQPKSKRSPTIAVKLLVDGVNWQLRSFSRQVQAAKLGVGGSVVDAAKTSLSAGQEGYVLAPAED